MISRNDIALAQRLADAAGAEIRPLFRSGLDSEAKHDASAVRQLDAGHPAGVGQLPQPSLGQAETRCRLFQGQQVAADRRVLVRHRRTLRAAARASFAAGRRPRS